jgi:hypothetical protein
MKSSSPKKGGVCSTHTPIPKLHNSPQNNSDSASAQLIYRPGIIWRRWEVEAGRLFREFWTTADDRHLTAFATHVRAMRGYAGRRK